MQYFSYVCVLFIIGILDIDYFKQLNDCYGYIVGDYVLKKMIKKICSVLCDEDFLVCIGGEEFVIILFVCLGDEVMWVFKCICLMIEVMEVYYE